MKVEQEYKKEAKKNQGARTDMLVNLPKSNPVHVSEKMAEKIGVSEKTYRQRGIGNTNPIKFGRCLKELDRIYGVKQGGSGYYGNQHEESPNNSETPKTQEDIATSIGISVDTYRNYKTLADMIPEIQLLVETRVVLTSQIDNSMGV